MPITVGSVEVDIVPNTRGIYPQLKAALVPAADRAGTDAGRIAGNRFAQAMAGSVGQGVGTAIGQQIGQQIASQISRQVSGALQQGVQTGGRRASASAGRSGEETGGAFARAMRARLEAAFRSMPRLDIRIGDTGVDAELARVRARLEALSGKRIGVDVDVAAADAQIAEIETELRRLGTYHPNVAVRADTAAALAQLAAMREEIARLNADPLRIRVETDGGFGARMRAAVASAQASLPEINVDANTDAANARVQALRAQLAALTTARVGIDIDAGAALAQLGAIRAALVEVAASDATIDVRVDAGRAAAELAALQAEADALSADRHHLRIRADTGSAMAALIALGVQLGILAGLQFGPVIAAGIGAIAASASVAAVGVGSLLAVAAPAIGGIKKALDAQKQAQDASTQATRNGAAAAAQAEQRSLQMAGAQQALAAAHRNAGQEIAAARQGVADAVQRAAERQQQAARQVAAAEQGLALAQRAARQAQLDLVAARKTAAEQLVDLNNQLTDSQLSQRDATIQVQQAQAELNRTMADRKSSDLQKAAAQLAFEQAVQHLKEQQTATVRLQAQTEQANQAGVDGSQTVLDAQDRVAAAQQEEQDRTQALADARREAAQQQLADARAVADAQAKAVSAQQQAADSISSAQRQVAAAQASAVASTDSAAAAQAKYEEALGRLSPAARGLMGSFTGLKSAFSEWSASLQPAVLPLFSRALDGIAGSLGKLSPIVLGTVDGVHELQDRFGAEMKTPFWQGFYQDLVGSVRPAVVGFGAALGNVFKGAAGIVDAFLPHMDGISSAMQRFTSRFADWGAGLKGSPTFEAFLDYVRQQGPQAGKLLGDIFRALTDIGKALAPIAGPILGFVDGLVKLVGWIARVNPGLLQAVYVIGLMTTAFGLLNAVLDANIFVLIGLGIALLVDGLIQAYQHVGWFRAAVDATWHAIAAAATWLWTTVLQPVFSAIWTGLQLVGRAAMWLWENAIRPAFGFIWEAAKILFAVVAVLVIAPLVIAFHVLADAAEWLWRSVLQPVWEGIAAGATWLWEHVLSPVLGYIADEFRALAEAGLWLWDHALKPAFDGIGRAASWLWENAIRPAFDGISAGASWLWEHALKPAFSAISDALKPVADAFGWAKDMIGKAWGELYDITKKPINFLIEMVYTNGIKAVWDKVADFVKLPHLPDGPKLLAAGGTVGNGFGPAVPMVTNRPTAIVGEGNPSYPEFVIPTDPKFRPRSLALLQAAGSKLMASGGVLSGIWDGVKGAGGAAWDFAKDGVDLLAHPGKAWDTLSKPIRDLFAKIGDSAMAKAVIGVPTQMLGGLKDRLLNFVGLGGGAGGPSGGSGVQRWSDVVLQSLAMVGQPASLLGTTLRRMNQESGGNPTIVNTTDSNWLAGTPSVGLMQVIGPTFRAYAGELASRGPFSYGTSVDPLANVYASMRYALSRYGSLSAAYDRPGGYDSGGYLPPGLSTVYNGTGRPEPVFTSQQWDAIQRGGVGERQLVVPVTYNAPMPENPQKAAMEIGRRVAGAVAL